MTYTGTETWYQSDYRVDVTVRPYKPTLPRVKWAIWDSSDRKVAGGTCGNRSTALRRVQTALRMMGVQTTY